MYGSVAEGGGRGAASRLWLERRVCSMQTVMLAGDFVKVRSNPNPNPNPNRRLC